MLCHLIHSFIHSFQFTKNRFYFVIHLIYCFFLFFFSSLNAWDFFFRLNKPKFHRIFLRLKQITERQKPLLFSWIINYLSVKLVKIRSCSSFVVTCQHKREILFIYIFFFFQNLFIRCIPKSMILSLKKHHNFKFLGSIIEIIYIWVI